MLTVNVKHGDSTETIMEADQVHVKWGVDTSKGDVDLVSIIKDDRHRDITQGLVFVMNEKGSTISRYELSGADNK